MSGFGEAHDVYVVFGHVVVDFVTFSLGVDALYVEGTDAVRGFVFDSLFSGRFGFLSLRRGLFLLSTMCPAGFASAGGAVRFRRAMLSWDRNPRAVLRARGLCLGGCWRQAGEWARWSPLDKLTRS